MEIGSLDNAGPNQVLATRYPALLRPAWHDPVRCRFDLASVPPPDEQIGTVNVVPFVGECAVVIHLANGAVEVPGGTLEPGELYLDAVRRELREEVGATLDSFTPFGCWRCVSSAAAPYRPHLPHPHFCRLVGYGEVTVTGRPTNPVGGEQVIAVDTLTVSEATARFRATGRHDLADLYRLAADLHASYRDGRVRAAPRWEGS